MTVYFNGDFVPKEEVKISPDDRGFLFGDGVYEVICAYEGQLFEAEAHWQRLERSLQEIRMTPPAEVDFEAVAQELLRRNDLLDRHAKVYLQITRGAAPRQHAFPDEPISPTVYATATPYEPPLKKWDEGVSVILLPDLRWSRCDIKSIALLPNVLASQRAKEAGVYEAVLVRREVVTEGSHCTFLGVFDGTVRTHPLNNNILVSITRAVVLELCSKLDIPVQEAPIVKKELEDADELILLGTTTGVMPVVQVDDWTVNTGAPGPITRQLQQAFRETAGI